MKKGDKVNVYEDPITRERLEGSATLVESLGRTDPDLGEWWDVHFDGDDRGAIYPRWVRP